MDIINVLNIPRCIRLKSSFNRANLHYEIREKTKSVNADIHAFIRTYAPGQSGVIYCTSRAACEEIAATLQVSVLIPSYSA